MNDETGARAGSSARVLAASAIRRTREHLGLSQEGLANRAGVSVRTVRSLELSSTSSPRFDTLSRIASALDLDPISRGRVLAAWGHLGDADGAGFSFGQVPFLDEIRHFAASVTMLHVDQTVWVNSLRTQVRTTSRMTLKVRRDAIAHAYVANEPDPRPADVDFVDLEGCAITADETAGNGVRVVQLALDQPAQQHDISTFAYSQVLRSNFAAAPPIDYAGAGFQTPTELYTLRIRFDPRALPQRVHQCVQDRPFGERRAVRSLPISRSASVLLAIENPRPGGHLVRWEW